MRGSIMDRLDDKHEELTPSDSPIISTGPARPPKISNSGGIPLPNLYLIMQDSSHSSINWRIE
jgi:hypothetical protein